MMSLERFFESAVFAGYGRARRALADRRERRRGAAPVPPTTARLVVGKRLDPLEPGGGMEGYGNAAPATAPLSIRREQLLTHCLFTGASGSGKSNAIHGLIRQILAMEGKERINLLILDQQGDLIDATLAFLVDAGFGPEDAARLGILDLRPAASGGTGFIVGLNGLAGPGDPLTRAEQFLAAWRSVSEGWGVSIDDTARAVLGLLTHCPGDAAITNVEAVLTVPAYRAELLRRLPDTVATAPIRAWFARYGALTEPARAALWMPVLNKLSSLLVGDVRLALAETEKALALHELMDHPQGSVTLICFDAARLQGASRFLSGMCLSMIENHILARASQPEHERRQVEIIVDEFPTLAPERFTGPITLFRRFRAGLCVAYQNQALLDPTIRQALRCNCALRCYLRTGSGVEAADVAADIVLPGVSRTRVRDLLLTQKPGRALACLPGRDQAEWIEIPHWPVPKVKATDVRALVAASLRAHGRTRAAAEARLLDTERRRRALADASTESGPRGRQAPVPEGTTLEVREVASP